MSINFKPTAAFVVIGNEILAGEIQDINTQYLAKNLTKLGIHLKEIRVVGDEKYDIIEAINFLKTKYNYIFTSGGLGPTHDDITASAIADAFGVKLKLDSQAKKMLDSYYGKQNMNESRLKMAFVPEGSTLIQNPISISPGFQIANIYVMAGVPSIFQVMFNEVAQTLKKGVAMLSHSCHFIVSEDEIAYTLKKIQSENEDVQIGSYPFVKMGKIGVEVIVRSENEVRLQKVVEIINEKIKPISEDNQGPRAF